MEGGITGDGYMDIKLLLITECEDYEEKIMTGFDCAICRYTFTVCQPFWSSRMFT